MPISTDELSLRISRDSPMPLYHQVAEHLRGLIASGELAAGEQLPNEIELAQRFALSRPTMRQALDELVRDGLISRRRGIGTVVTPQHFRRGAGLTSVFDDLLAAGRQPTTEVLSVRLEDGPHDVATTFGLADGEQLVALERLRCADGEPLVLMRNWLPSRYAFLQEVDLADTGLYHVMRERGDVPVTARKAISACAAAQRPAQLLGVRKGEPLLRVRHVGYDARGRLLDVGDHLYRGGDHAVEVVVS
ncbi:MAG: GntR family transcriptional regulator [Acidimicrobiales bacterium]